MTDNDLALAELLEKRLKNADRSWYDIVDRALDRRIAARLRANVEVGGEYSRGMLDAAKMADEHNSFAKMGERLSFNDLSVAIRKRVAALAAKEG